MICPTPPVLPPPLVPAADTSPLPVSRLRWWIHLLILLAFPLAAGLLALERTSAAGAALTDRASGLIRVSALQLLWFGAVFGLAWLASRASRDDLFLRWRPGWWVILLGAGYSVALRFLAGGAVLVAALFLLMFRIVSAEQLQHYFIHNRPDVEAIVDVEALRRSPLYYWLSLTLVSFVVAGLREELWRAGVLAALQRLWPRTFSSGLGRVLAVGLVAMVFGLGHLPQGWLGVAITTVLGLGLGLIIVLHKSIWPAVIAHGLFDATSLALIPWALDRLREFR